MAGHGERWKILELVMRKTSDVEKYMDSCNMCQRIKNRIETLAEKLKLSEIPEKL